MERSEETRLIARSQAGDPTAFARLVEEHRGLVLKLCVRSLGNVEDGRDVAQEAFLQAFVGLDQFRQESRFATWLYRIAVNLCQTALRRRAPVPDLLEESLPDPGPSPDGVLAGRERRRGIDQALARLSPELRSAVVLRDVLGFSYAEIADCLTVPLGTVKSRISAARWTLRDALGDCHDL